MSTSRPRRCPVHGWHTNWTYGNPWNDGLELLCAVPVTNSAESAFGGQLCSRDHEPAPTAVVRPE